MKEKKKSKIEIVLLCIIVILLAVTVGLKRIELSDFSPINGDFQNYNVIRRFLNGQIPYKDFAVYLGTGHLIFTSLFVLVFGNNFTTSLFTTNMLTMFLFEYAVFLVSFFITKDKRKALYFCIVFALINIIRPQFIQFLDSKFTGMLDFGFKPGTSARLIRIAVSLISVTLTYIGFKCIDKSKKDFIITNNGLLKKILMAVIAGGMILWSNDGGVATYISYSFVYFLLLIKEYKKDILSIIKYTFLYILISLSLFLLLLLLVTRGHIFSWFKYNFGVSSYQKWYYGEAIEKKNISIFDLDASFFNIVLIIVSIVYIYKFFKTKEKKEAISYALLNVLIITAIISTYLYQLLSGGTSDDFMYLILYVIAFNYICLMVLEFVNQYNFENTFKIVIIVSCCATIINTTVGIISDRKKAINEDVVYIEPLKGYFSEYGESIKIALDKIGDNKIFSTYASAVEVATGQFQPTGYDYIIHCMGNEQRDEYMKIFRQQDFKYVATVDRDFNLYRYWIRNANWFFYRELYKNYKPSFATEYNVFFEKTEEKPKLSKQNISIETKKESDSKYVVKVKVDDINYNGIVDVKIAYSSCFKESVFKTFDINRYVYVNDITTKKITNLNRVNYNLPKHSEEYYIPITVINGEGKIEIFTCPEKNSELYINSIEAVDSYDVMFKYCVATSKEPIDGKFIYIDNNKENKVILNNVKQLKINNKIQNVVSYNDEDSEKYIIVQLEDDASEFAYPNFFEVIK